MRGAHVYPAVHRLADRTPRCARVGRRLAPDGDRRAAGRSSTILDRRSPREPPSTPDRDRRSRVRRLPGRPHAVPRWPRGAAEIVLINPTDYFLYLPLLPEVAAGILEPRRVVGVAHRHAAAASGWCSARSTTSTSTGRRVTLHRPRGRRRRAGLRPARPGRRQRQQAAADPGRRRARARLPRHARGAVPARPHHPADRAGRPPPTTRPSAAARCTFVVVGAGYTGTEVAAQGVLFTDALAAAEHRLRRDGPRPRWLLLDIADRVLPELDERLSRTADRVLRAARRRGPHRAPRSRRPPPTACCWTTASSSTPASLIWCVGVRPDPLVEDLGLPTEQGPAVRRRSTSTCPATRRCSPAGTPPPCPT